MHWSGIPFYSTGEQTICLNIKLRRVYIHTSFIVQKEKSKRYLIDLGKVYFTAEVELNGKVVGKNDLVTL
jgi:hypothetical protein